MYSKSFLSCSSFSDSSIFTKVLPIKKTDLKLLYRSFLDLPLFLSSLQTRDLHTPVYDVISRHKPHRLESLTRQVYNGPRVVKFIPAILSVYQYFLGKTKFWSKNYLDKTFYMQDIAAHYHNKSLCKVSA